MHGIIIRWEIRILKPKLNLLLRRHKDDMQIIFRITSFFLIFAVESIAHSIYAKPKSLPDTRKKDERQEKTISV